MATLRAGAAAVPVITGAAPQPPAFCCALWNPSSPLTYESTRSIKGWSAILAEPLPGRQQSFSSRNPETFMKSSLHSLISSKSPKSHLERCPEPRLGQGPSPAPHSRKRPPARRQLRRPRNHSVQDDDRE